jgi:uncharacterized protein (DUF305 family)
VFAAAALAGCGPGEPARNPAGPASASAAAASAAAAAAAGANPVDVMFLQMMLPHHAQGLAIVRLASSRPIRGDVRNLAAAIEATQSAESATMAGWLTAWRQPSTVPDAAHASHGGTVGTSAAEINRLAMTPDATFERDFLNLLLAHQDDAVQVARMETGAGIHPDARNLAERIDRSRSAQIKLILGFLGQS